MQFIFRLAVFSTVASAIFQITVSSVFKPKNNGSSKKILGRNEEFQIIFILSNELRIRDQEFESQESNLHCLSNQFRIFDQMRAK